MTLAIVHYNAPVLRQKGAAVTTFDLTLAKLAADMVATMHAAKGIGLAAQQIGLALQLCVVDLRETDRDFSWELDGAQTPLELIMPMVLANPRVEPLPSAKTVYEEGCLSFPGTPHVLVCNGLFGRCIQHEADHLNGTLFIDRMDKTARRPIERAITALAAQTRAAAEKGVPPAGSAPCA
jgi:peptide deformylase